MKDPEKIIEILVDKIKQLETDLFFEKIRAQNAEAKNAQKTVEQRPTTIKAEETR